MPSDPQPLRVLILAHDFPPLISIGGLRPYSWYKYLPQYGADVTVVTRDWEHDEGVRHTGFDYTGERRRIIRARFIPGIKEWLYSTRLATRIRPVRRFITYLFLFLEYLSLRFDSTAAIYHEADKLLAQERFDVIIATGKPFILFRYARLLSQRYGLPWVADYRDSWTLNHVQLHTSQTLLDRLLNAFYTRMERRDIATAQRIITAAPSYTQYIPVQAQNPEPGIIYNGYDDDIEPITDAIPVPSAAFTISYAGLIYPMQNLELFLEAAVLFIQQRAVPPAAFEIHFWGIKGEAAVESRILGYSALLHPYLHFHSKVSYTEVMKKLSASHMLLLLTAGTDGWLNAKLFDYLVLKRAILMLGSQGNIMAPIIRATHAGTVTISATGAAQQLAAHYDQYRNAQPNPTIHYQQYSRRHQAGALYQLLLPLRRR